MPAVTLPIEPTPEGVLGFWLGALREPAAATEDAWRERMLRWRVGVFARAFEDAEFAAVQRAVCEHLHQHGHDAFFAPAALWDTPHGQLAKLIVLDQFPRCVYRGTPLAYENDESNATLIQRIIDQGWDLDVYNVLERLWVYIALSHPESRALQELSVDRWSRWSADLVHASTKAQRRVHQRVGWAFLKAVIEHGEAVLLHGKFPHRNAILCRPHRAGDVYYLTSELRPMWSFTQPPRPDYYALHAALHASGRRVDCRAFGRDALLAMHGYLGLDPAARERSLMDVFDAPGRERIGYRELYRQFELARNEALRGVLLASPAYAAHDRAIRRAIFRDETASWPPRSARASVPKVIDVPALNLAIRCPLLERGEVCVPRTAIDSYVEATRFQPGAFSELHARYQTVIAQARESFEPSRAATRRNVPIDPRAFERIVGPLFLPSPAREHALSTLYELLDLDYDGTVDAAEMVVALVVLCTGSVEEKLRVIFHVFDGDGSGSIDRDELRDLVHTTLLRGLHVVESLFRSHLPEGTRESIDFVVLFSLASFGAIEADEERALAAADTDGDGRVDETEFLAWATRHPLLTQLLTLSRSLFGV